LLLGVIKIVLSYVWVLAVWIFFFLHSELYLLVLVHRQGEGIALYVVLAVVGVWSFSKQHLL
jgi:hypothetical protein